MVKAINENLDYIQCITMGVSFQLSEAKKCIEHILKSDDIIIDKENAYDNDYCITDYYGRLFYITKLTLNDDGDLMIYGRYYDDCESGFYEWSEEKQILKHQYSIYQMFVILEILKSINEEM